MKTLIQTQQTQQTISTDRTMPKHPSIRPGQRKPYVKGSRQQIDERIGFVARLLRAGKTKTQIHRDVRKKFNIAWRQTDRYLALLKPG